MSTQKKVLDSDGLEHLIALIKGADASLKSELVEQIEQAISGVGPGISADEVTITNQDSVISVKDGGIVTDKLAYASVTADKLADGAITKEKLDLSGSDPIEPGDIGAAPAEHTHDASDIVSGAVPVSHGGTGATTIDGARTVLFNFPEDDELLSYLGLS